MTKAELLLRSTHERLGGCLYHSDGCDEMAICRNCVCCLQHHQAHAKHCNGGKPEPMRYTIEDFGWIEGVDYA